MLDFFKNKKQEKEQDDSKITNFIEICDFLESFTKETLIAIIITLFLGLSFFNIFDNWVLRLVFCLLTGKLFQSLLYLFTIDRQSNIIYSHFKYPMIVNELAIDKNDELENIDKENPSIPGIILNYNIKESSSDKFAITFQVDEQHYKILTLFECKEKMKHAKKKIESEILLNSFSGLKKDYIYAEQCLIFNIVKLKKEVKDLDIIDVNDIDETLIITETVYYPYIK